MYRGKILLSYYTAQPHTNQVIATTIEVQNDFKTDSINGAVMSFKIKLTVGQGGYNKRV
jgi:hypothetical protein